MGSEYIPIKHKSTDIMPCNVGYTPQGSGIMNEQRYLHAHHCLWLTISQYVENS